MRVAVALADLSRAPSTAQPPSHFPSSSNTATAAGAAGGDGAAADAHTSSDSTLTTVMVLELWLAPSGADVWPSRAPPPLSSRSQLLGSAHSDRSNSNNSSGNDSGLNAASAGTSAGAAAAAAAAVPDLNLPDALPTQRGELGGQKGGRRAPLPSSSAFGPQFSVCCVGTLSGASPAAGLSLSADGLFLGVSFMN